MSGNVIFRRIHGRIVALRGPESTKQGRGARVPLAKRKRNSGGADRTIGAAVTGAAAGAGTGGSAYKGMQTAGQKGVNRSAQIMRWVSRVERKLPKAVVSNIGSVGSKLGGPKPYPYKVEPGMLKFKTMQPAGGRSALGEADLLRAWTGARSRIRIGRIRGAAQTLGKYSKMAGRLALPVAAVVGAGAAISAFIGYQRSKK